MNLQETQRQFMDACNQFSCSYPAAPEAFKNCSQQVSLQQILIQEECAELIKAVDLCHEFKDVPNIYWTMMAEVLAESVDLIYVVLGLCNTLGLPVNAMFTEIHRANMDKAVDGKVMRREDGKIMKPEGWKPANKLDVVLMARDYKV